MSFLQHLASVNKSTGTFKVVRSHLKDWQKLVGVTGFLLLFIGAMFFFAGRFPGKTPSALFTVAIGGMLLIPLLSKLLLGGYRPVGNLFFEDERLIIADLEGNVQAAVPYSELKLVRRMVGIPLTRPFIRNSRPATAYVQLILTDRRPPIEFETEWRSSLKNGIEITDVLDELRAFKKLSP